MLGGGSCGPVRGCVALRRGPKDLEQRLSQARQERQQYKLQNEELQDAQRLRGSSPCKWKTTAITSKKSEEKHDGAALYSDPAQPCRMQDTQSLATTLHMIQHQPRVELTCSNASHNKQRNGTIEVPGTLERTTARQQERCFNRRGYDPPPSGEAPFLLSSTSKPLLPRFGPAQDQTQTLQQQRKMVLRMLPSVISGLRRLLTGQSHRCTLSGIELRQVITAPQMALPEGYRQAAHRLHNATEKAAPLLQDLITAPFVVKGHVGCQKVQ
ncbi:hypothetical protein ABBQ32_010195 [Trebouxia sp. C0010 RCD-2024]